jgi:hypothetical protein
LPALRRTGVMPDSSRVGVLSWLGMRRALRRLCRDLRTPTLTQASQLGRTARELEGAREPSPISWRLRHPILSDSETCGVGTSITECSRSTYANIGWRTVQFGRRICPESPGFQGKKHLATGPIRQKGIGARQYVSRYCVGGCFSEWSTGLPWAVSASGSRIREKRA